MNPRIFIVIFVLAIGVAGAHADCAVPPNYKNIISEMLAAKHPTYSDISCSFYAPVRVLVGDKKKELCAVRCDWSASEKGLGGPLSGVRKNPIIPSGTMSA